MGENYPFEVVGSKNAQEDVVELAEKIHEADVDETVKLVDKKFGFIVFDNFKYKFNGMMKLALKEGMVISAVRDPDAYGNGEIGLYFKPLKSETVERQVTVEEEVFTFGRKTYK